MDKYESLDKELAEALGWTLRKGNLCGLPPGYVGNLWSMPVPRWTQDDAVCFRLMVEHNVSWMYMVTHAKVAASGSEWIIYEDYKDHSHDKAKTLRVAIVKSIIVKLKQEKK